MVLLSPVLELLHYHYPQINLDFAIFQHASILPLQHAPYLGKVFKCSFQPQHLIKDIVKLRKERYDLSLVSSGINASKAGLYAKACNTKEIVGEYRHNTSVFYTLQRRFDPEISRTMNNLRNFELVFDLPMHPDVYKSRYYYDSKVDIIAKDFIGSHFDLSKPIVAIHPGCNIKNRYRRWPVHYFVELIKLLKKSFADWQFYVIAGPDEQEEGHYIKQILHLPVLENVSLDTVAACLSQSDILINTDSGIGHIASCFEKRIYTIFGPGDEKQTAPFGANAKVIRHEVPCAPCVRKNIRKCDVSCLNLLTPQRVAEIITASEESKFLDK